jgi:hypothetical protein
MDTVLQRVDNVKNKAEAEAEWFLMVFGAQLKRVIVFFPKLGLTTELYSTRISGCGTVAICS